MRLIDADALIEALKKKHEHWHDIVPEEHADIEFAYTYAVNVVRNAPTVEASGGLISGPSIVCADKPLIPSGEVTFTGTSDTISRADAIETVTDIQGGSGQRYYLAVSLVDKICSLPSADAVQGEWISRIDNDIWMLECSVCGCRVQEEKYRIAVGQNATKCPYCGAELGLGGYSYDEYADRPSQRGEK